MPESGSRPEGRCARRRAGEAIARLAETPHILLNAPLVGQRLGYPDVSGLDLLELFAFIHPARFAVPTVPGLARACGIEPPATDAEAAATLIAIAEALLARLAAPDWAEREGAWTSNATLYRLGWGWAPFVGQRLAKPERGERMLFSRLPQWEEQAERPQPKSLSIPAADAEAKLAELTGGGCGAARGPARHGGRSGLDLRAAPNGGRAQHAAGRSGDGDRQDARLSRTCRRSGPSARRGTVWVSTFTKALQRQLDAEGRRLFPDEEERKRRIVIRKGRENYLCLLNLEDAMQGAFAGRAAVLAQLVGRWAAYTKDGDMVGGDLPGWLPSLFRRAGAAALTDRRGECVYAGCPHYRKCFIERAERAGREADIVIANHALVMVNAARGRPDAPSRIIFDEGPSSVRCRGFDLFRRADRAGSDRDAALDRRAGRQVARAAARPGGAAARCLQL